MHEYDIKALTIIAIILICISFMGLVYFFLKNTFFEDYELTCLDHIKKKVTNFKEEKTLPNLMVELIKH